MMKHESGILLRLALAAALSATGAISCERTPAVSFAADVKPVLDRYCLECHQAGGAGFAASGLDMTTYANLMQGTRNGPMVVAGDTLGSNLVVLMEGRADPAIAMPHGGMEKVSAAEIETIKTWIDQGAANN
ncbi:MAG: hypothetical protein HKN58_03140 [Xanthomonadales bacterium]|nr:hypothetical protein [Xanthomonadales bacterium]